MYYRDRYEISKLDLLDDDTVNPYLKDQTEDLDENHDGKVSLYEFKARGGLTNLPPPGEKQFNMQIMFDTNAGNDFQGDTLEMTLTFTVNQDDKQFSYTDLDRQPKEQIDNCEGNSHHSCP